MKSSLITRALQLLLVSTTHHGLSTAKDVIDQWLFNPETNTRAAVASEAYECTHVGRGLLAKGGNAIDAIVGMAFCVGVMAPYHAGIGGGGFMLVRDKNGEYEAIDFRETAPAKASENMYKEHPEKSVYGGLSVAVPGEVAGLWYAHKKYGRLPWLVVMEGAIWKAKVGFPLNSDFISYIGKALKGKDKNFLTQDPSWAKDFAHNGELKKEGDWVKRTRYANTLIQIARKGPGELYNGPTGKHLINTIKARGGIMELSDLKNYTIETREILNTTHRGYKVFTFGSPASGAVSLNILNTLEGYGAPKKESAQDWHRFVEASKFAYGSRGNLGDPAFSPNVSSFEKLMLDKDYALKIRRKIHNKPQNLTMYDPWRIYAAENHGTSHMVAADNQGYAVSLTTTVNLLFGSLIMCDKTGIVLNNEMNDFSIPGVPNEFGFQPSPYNYIRPGKRPLSSITPVIVEREDGRFFAAVGAAGGSRIISSTTQVLWRILSSAIGIKEAVAEPRLHDQLMPNTVLTEQHFSEPVTVDLRKRGHNITYVEPGLSIVEGVMQDPKGRFEAGSDPRQKNHCGERL
ncbi:gamma-glutamyltranspeptidase [Ilyonectria robusta]|uniref:gamma-glutamyltranspeptidase n=1 Tax=Ilyonectria robusta TaxID=1079257 RepID=UPI001E8DBC41|nr:gamma-glutamyltranspeptidase [Ilyonectria robusta]KAH8694756.1 gamma-glutamyltranspeptidase [Ilyonectria robusta]